MDVENTMINPVYTCKFFIFPVTKGGFTEGEAEVILINHEAHEGHEEGYVLVEFMDTSLPKPVKIQLLRVEQLFDQLSFNLRALRVLRGLISGFSALAGSFALAATGFSAATAFFAEFSQFGMGAGKVSTPLLH
jgi:hypothetical protein